MKINADLLMSICSVFGVEESSILMDMKLNELDGYDSFKLVDLMITLETGMGINFSSKDLDNLNKISDLNNLILLKLK